MSSTSNGAGRLAMTEMRMMADLEAEMLAQARQQQQQESCTTDSNAGTKSSHRKPKKKKASALTTAFEAAADASTTTELEVASSSRRRDNRGGNKNFRRKDKTGLNRNNASNNNLCQPLSSSSLLGQNAVETQERLSATAVIDGKMGHSHEPTSKKIHKEPCRRFLNGNCSYGKNCWFSHDEVVAKKQMSVLDTKSNDENDASRGATVSPAEAARTTNKTLTQQQQPHGLTSTPLITQENKSRCTRKEKKVQRKQKTNLAERANSPPAQGQTIAMETNEKIIGNQSSDNSLVSTFCRETTVSLLDPPPALTSPTHSKHTPPAKGAPASPANDNPASTTATTLTPVVIAAEAITTTTTTWACAACTLENEVEDDTCQVCGTNRPENDKAWYCASCTFLNQEETATSCSACQEPRLLSSTLSEESETSVLVALDEETDGSNNTRETEAVAEIDTEARAEYRKARNAAKKARRQQERLAKQEEPQDPIQSEFETAANAVSPVTVLDSPNGNQSAKKKPVTRDFGNKSEKTNASPVKNETMDESKKDKKSKRQRRFELRMLELDNAHRRRSEVWQAEINNQTATINLMMMMCATEMERLGAAATTHDDVLQNGDTKMQLLELCRPVYTHLYGKSVNVRIAGMTQQHQHLNDRKGKIEHYDTEKGKFYVGLETRKGRNREYLFFDPGNLEQQPNPTKKKGWKNSCAVRLTVGLLEIERDIVDKLRDLEADQVAVFLDEWAAERSRQEEADRVAMEEEERRYEEARREAAERRRRKEEEWQQEKAEFARRRAEYEAWEKAAKQQRRKERRSADHKRFCDCPRCELQHLFMFYSVYGDGFGAFFDFEEDSDNDYGYGRNYDYDDFFERQQEESEQVKLQEAADILGVTVDATQQEIKRAYRRKARKYHPDSYSPEQHADGMTKKEAEDHFKEIADAYATMTSSLDDNRSSE